MSAPERIWASRPEAPNDHEDWHGRRLDADEWAIPSSEYIRADVAASHTRQAVRKALEGAATMVADFSWHLPLHRSRSVNEATDDAACMVQEQIANAIRRELASLDAEEPK